MRRGEASPCGRARQSRVRRGLPRGMDSIGPCGRARQTGVNREWPSTPIQSPTAARDWRPGRNWAVWPHYAGNQLTNAVRQRHELVQGTPPHILSSGRAAGLALRADDTYSPRAARTNRPRGGKLRDRSVR